LESEGKKMMCYECALQGAEREAVGMCHNCSIGLCAEHGKRVKTLVPHPTNRSFAPDVPDQEIPTEAERFLCSSCAQAMQRRHFGKVA
jgi:hypothetical protein